MSIDSAVLKEIHTNKNQYYIFPTVTSPPLTPIDNQLIFNNITLFKSSKTTRTNNKSNSGTVLLTVQQKLDNLQQQIEDRIIYCKATEKRK